MTTLLIDGDPIAYQCAFANQSSISWDDDEPTVTHDEAAAIEDADRMIRKLKSDFGAKAVVVCLSVATAVGWRRTLLPTYKANRNKTVKPLALEPIRQHLLQKWKAYIRPTLEADDVLGILATHKHLVKGEKIIVSIDKDLLQIPGRVFHPRRDELVEVTKEEADHLHMMQTLTGDTVDGYSGLPGVGPVKAKAILNGARAELAQAEGGRVWDFVAQAYERAGLTEADALVQARVARICRASDYDFKAKKVKLWNPPTSS